MPLLRLVCPATKPVTERTKHRVSALELECRMPTNDKFEFITQTLSPSLYRLPSHKQFERTHRSLLSILRYLGDDWCFKAEVTQYGNVHYHMWIVFKDGKCALDYIDCVKAIPNYFGNFKFTEVFKDKDIETQKYDSYKYLRKDMMKSYKYIRSSYIVMNPYDNEDLDEKEITISVKELDAE